MPRSPKFISIITLLMIIFSALSKPSAPVAAVEPQVPSSPGTWSQDFGLYTKTADNSYTPLRPIEWNGTLYAILNGHDNFESGVGYWNGQQWLKIDGLNGQVDALTVHQNRLYVAGRFTFAGKSINLASWDGNLWTAIPTQIVQYGSFLLASYANQLYLGADELSIDGQAYGSLARWDGEQWHTAAAGIDGVVFTMLARPDGLYLGGSFIFNNQKTSLLYWDGTQWQLVGGGVYGHVFDLKWANSQLYVSGNFTSTLVPTIHNVAAWNGTNWDAFGTGLTGWVTNVTVMDGELYALRQTRLGFGFGYDYLHWNGTEWTLLTDLGSINSSYSTNWLFFPRAVFVQYQQELLLVGEISYSSGSPEPISQGDSALRWNGTHWEPMNSQGLLTQIATAIATADENLLVASSSFYWSQDVASLAQFGSNQRWQKLVDRRFTSESVQALEAFQQSHFMVSYYTLYEAASTTWNQIGAFRVVRAIAQSNNLLYVAGDFEQFNGVTAHNLVTWDGTQWQALNAPASFDKVVLVEAHGNDVYISDGFQLARWDGTQWTTLATNVVNIGSIEATATGVYIAGTFSSVGGVAAPKIAYWNGTAWSGLSGTISGSILDLEMGADGLYVAGGFRGIINGVVSPGILRWDGMAWHGVGGGVQSHGNSSGIVQRLAATPTRMFMYGDFNWVGNQYESFTFAVWEYGDEPLIKAKPDYAITYRPQAVTVNVLANDWSYQPAQLQLVNLTAPSHGTAVINGNSVLYTPDAQFEGVETLTYTLRDPINAVTTTAQIQIHVWNHFPTIADQEQTIYPFVETLIDPLAGLIDLNGDSLTITQASAITGTLTIVNNQLRYMPPNQEHFTDVVTYTVSDGHGGQQTARIKLHSIDSAVHAVDDYATTYRPHAVNVAVLANDWSLDNEPIELVAVGAASHGTATISGNQVRYVPAANFQGTDTVEYTVRNQTRGVTATGTLTIAAQNHAPTVAPITITMRPGSTTIIDTLNNLIDLNGDPTGISNVQVTAGSFELVYRELHYTAPNTYPFTATITYTLFDDHDGSSVVTIAVNSGNYQQVFLPYTSK